MCQVKVGGHGVLKHTERESKTASSKGGNEELRGQTKVQACSGWLTTSVLGRNMRTLYVLMPANVLQGAPHFCLREM